MVKIEQVKFELNDAMQPIAQVNLSINLEDIQNTMAIHGPDFFKELQAMIGDVVLDSIKNQKEIK